MNPVGACVLVVAALLVAGCSSHSAPTSSSSSTSQSHSGSSTFTQPPDPKRNTTSDSELTLTECRGAGVQLVGPFAIYKGEVPQGWEPNTDSPLNTILVLVHRCERITWGPFERGPIFVVQDWQSNFTDPPKCQENRQGTRFAMASIIFSDPEVAAYAREVHGMNAYAANFTFSNSPSAQTPGIRDWTWTWTISGHAASRFAVHDPEIGSNFTPTAQNRVYWFNGEGISYMDYSSTFEASSLNSGPAEGVLSEPMTWGTYGPPQFATAYFDNLEDHASIQMPLTKFADVQCEQPPQSSLSYCWLAPRSRPTLR